MRRLDGHTKDVRAVCFLPDGRLASGGSDSTVRIWDPRTGASLHVLRAGRVVYSLAPAPDGRWLACGGRIRGSWTGQVIIQLWDPDTGREASTLTWQKSHHMSRSVWSLSYSAEGEYLAAAGRMQGSANILNGGGGHWWRLRTAIADADLTDPDVYAVAFAPTGTMLALSRQRAVAILDHPAGPERLSYALQSSWATAMAFVPPGDTLVTAASSYLHLLETNAKRRPKKLKTGLRSVTSVAVSPDGRTLLAGGRAGAVEVYDLSSLTVRTTLDFELGAVHALAFAPDGTTFAAGGDKGLLVCDAD